MAAMHPPSGTLLRTGTVGVSIPVPDPHGSLLRSKRAEYGDPLAPLVPPHVTLLGPMDVSTPDLPHLVDHLAAVAEGHAPFTMELRGTGTFRPVSPVVFIQVVSGGAGCAALEQSLRTADYERQLDFPYHPHVTVAHDVPEPMLDHAALDLAEFGAAFRVDEFWLYERDSEGLWVPIQPFAMTGLR